jgi:Rrf2 family nitric oxide-sensitive transcriptional repressor
MYIGCIFSRQQLRKKNMQFTHFTDYSLRTLMYLGMNPNRLCTVKEIAEYHKISKNHLVKVVHNLSQLGYIKSTKGKGGGICLLKKPEKINLRDLIIQLELNLTLVECFNKKTNTCHITDACGLKHILRESLQSFTDTLEKYTLADTIVILDN